MVVTIVLGLFLFPAAIHAQPDPYSGAASPVEQPASAENAKPVKNVFSVKIKDALQSLFGRMKAMITGQGGSLQGNEHAGSFEGESALGTIKGEYRRVSDTEIEITILCKPVLVPYRTIEAKIRESLG